MNKYCITTYDYSYYWGWNDINIYLDLEELDITNIYFKPELGVIVVNPYIIDILNNRFFKEKTAEKSSESAVLPYFCTAAPTLPILQSRKTGVCNIPCIYLLLSCTIRSEDL